MPPSAWRWGSQPGMKRLKSINRGHCALHLQQNTCQHDSTCNWDHLNSQCRTLATVSSASAAVTYSTEPNPSHPSALLLFLASFISTLLGICAYNAVVAFRESWYKQKEAPE